MNNEIILPVKFPPVRSYPAETYLFSILLNYEQPKSWIFNNYINLYGYITPENWIYQAYTFDDFRHTCPFITTTSFNSIDIINNHFNGISPLLKSCIASGYYLILQYQQYYLSITGNYKTGYRTHEMLVYGFNEQENIFNIGEFYKPEGFAFGVVPSLDLEESIRHVTPDMFRIDAIKYIDVEYQFNYKLLHKELDNYINSQRAILEYEEVSYTPAEIIKLSQNWYTYGLNNYNLIEKIIMLLIEYINAERSKDKIDGVSSRILRSTHVLYAHKELMLERLYYFVNNGIITTSSLIPMCKQLINLCLINRNLFIKYLATGSVSYLEGIVKNYRDAKVLDCDFMCRLKESIK